MNGQELATAVQYGLADRVRRHRQRHVRDDPHAPGAPLSRSRVSGTDLVNPDFAELARAYGAHGETVLIDRRIRAGVRARAGSARVPRCCTSRVDPQALTMNATLDELREQGWDRS